MTCQALIINIIYTLLNVVCNALERFRRFRLLMIKITQHDRGMNIWINGTCEIT